MFTLIFKKDFCFVLFYILQFSILSNWFCSGFCCVVTQGILIHRKHRANICCFLVCLYGKPNAPLFTALFLTIIDPFGLP